MPPADDIRRGSWLLVGAAVWFSLMSVVVKRAGVQLPVEMLVLARGAVTLVLSYVFVRRAGLSIWGVDKPRLVLRGVLGLGGLACFFTAVTVLPLAEATVFHYLNPIFTTILAALLLRERVGLALVGAIIVSLAGTVLVARPALLFGEGAALPAAGVLAALGGAIFSAAAYVTVRRLRLTDHPDVIIFCFPAIAVPATLPFAWRAWVWPSLEGWLLMLGIGVFAQLGQAFLTRGLALVPAGRGTSIGYLQVAMAATWGVVLFGEKMRGWTIFGAMLILAATLVLMRRHKDS